MNVMNMLVAQVAPAPNAMKRSTSEGSSTSFHTIMLAGQGSNDVLQSTEGELTEESIASIMLGMDSEQLQELLGELLQGDFTGLEELGLTMDQEEQLQQILLQLESRNDLSLEELKELIILSFSEMLDENLHEDTMNSIVIDTNIPIVNDNSIYNEMVQLIGEINRILSDGEDVPLKEKASALLPLLRQWVSLQGQTDENDTNKLINDELSDKNATIWKQLVSVYEKRSHFTDSNIYKSDSAITRSDVMNWLEQAFNRYEANAESTRVNAPVVSASQAIPMSEIQQHTIHVNSLDRVDRVSDELLTKFNNIIRESRFLTNNNVNQLSITLRPDNLGNMTVRFTQIDGEMAVRIMVSSQAAQTMLESNLHQLKHMFSPHQVVIERTEGISDEEFFGKEEELEEHDEETMKDGEESRENDNNDTQEFDFSEVFQQFQQSSEEELESD